MVEPRTIMTDLCEWEAESFTPTILVDLQHPQKNLRINKTDKAQKRIPISLRYRYV